MLTEDIDASMRVLEAGGQIASDPGLISRELATTTVRQIWNQRLRWAQGWTQVSVRHLWQMLRLPHFNSRQKFGVFALLFQREIYPWISFQILPLLLFWWVRGDVIEWVVPIFVATTIFATTVGPGRVIIAYRLAHPTLKRKRWFLQYGFFSIFLYTEAKNIIARVGHLKELMGESSWRVTPRSADPGGAGLPPLVGESVFDSPRIESTDEEDSLEPAAVPEGDAPMEHAEMLLHTRRTTGSCLWCGETRSIDVDTCSRCGNGWIDVTLDEAARGLEPEDSDHERAEEATSGAGRRWAMFGLAAAAAATVAVVTFSPAAETAQVPTTLGNDTGPAEPVAATTSAAPPTTVPPATLPPTTLPATTVPPSTIVPVTTPPPPSTTSTTTTTTTLPPLPASAPLPADSIDLGAFALGPLRFGSSGDYAAASLVGTFGQPDFRLEADESWGLCPSATGRVLQWGGLSVIFRDDGDRELFVGYRYEGAPMEGGNGLHTISGLEPGTTLEDAQRLYLSSVIATDRLEDGSAIFLLLRSSDRRTLLWGPVGGSEEAPIIEGVYSYRSCDRGPFAG